MKNGASMRPRHKAAENRDQLVQRRHQLVASMRPRHKAAENSNSTSFQSPTKGGFNEAAA